MVQENIRTVRAKIAVACERVNRDPSEVTLIAVSKTKPVEMMKEALECGQLDFGENKAQEINWKKEELPDCVNWHMIGHLQRNKVKYVVGVAKLIHSVDSLRLAEAISAEAVKKNVVVPILIEVNVAEEESKFGTACEDTISLIESVSGLPNIKIEGLMTIAPFVDDPEKNRPVFRKLKQLSVDIKSKNMNNVSVDILSMGMTGDYEVAVEEGATMVRVGTGIFGERDYSK